MNETTFATCLTALTFGLLLLAASYLMPVRGVSALEAQCELIHAQANR